MENIIIKENDEAIYIQLKEHPKKVTYEIVDKNVDIASLIKNYIGPSIYFNFNKDGTLIGIEILK
ncbi:DUF2283 domain-containing protein [Chishuiella changwenlii]|uniref:DUF2283 domain-containing protein n=1 Tax=Chishuiella changwenlii TaxID=1434701 RepID=UPI002FD98458